MFFQHAQERRHVWRIVYFTLTVLVVASFSMAQESKLSSPQKKKISNQTLFEDKTKPSRVKAQRSLEIETISTKNLSENKTKPLIKSDQIKGSTNISPKITPANCVLQKNIQVAPKAYNAVPTTAINLKKETSPGIAPKRILEIKKPLSKEASSIDNKIN